MDNRPYVLVKKPDGSHYEEFCGYDEPERLMELAIQAKNGVLGGHVPTSDWASYRFRPTLYPSRILLKLEGKRSLPAKIRR